MSEVIERAIERLRGIGVEKGRPDYSDDTAAVVLAVLEAIREPTPGMIEAGRALQSIGDEDLYPDDMRAKYQVMIDKLIAEAKAASPR